MAEAQFLISFNPIQLIYCFSSVDGYDQDYLLGLRISYHLSIFLRASLSWPSFKQSTVGNNQSAIFKICLLKTSFLVYYQYKFKLGKATIINKMQSQEQQRRNASVPPPFFDEKPVGASQKLDLSQYPPDWNPDQLNVKTKSEPLPISKRVISKVFKVRKEAFQQLLNEVTENYKVYEQFYKQTVTFITDSNQICQQRALKVLLKYLEGGPTNIQQPRPVVKALIQRCLVIQKGEATSIATEIMFWFMDHYQAVIINEVNQNMLNKNPKICASTLAFLEKLVSNYGAKKLKHLQEFGKNFTLLSSTVRPVAKQQTINLFKQIFKWMGQNTFNFNMHPQIKDEIVKFSKTYVKEPMIIKRGLNEQQKKSKRPITESADEQNEEPQDVLGVFDSRWVDKVLEQPKWKQKKSMLDEFIKKTKVKNIVSRDSSQYITLIKRLLTDNNINLLQCGLRVVKNLCSGLKKNFSQPCRAIMSPIFFKLRDTKAMIVDEVQQTLQSMISCIHMDDMLEDIKEGLKDKGPNMRFQTLRFIQKLASKKEKKFMNAFKNITMQIVELNQDGSSEVREKSLDVLCKLKAAFGLNFFGDKLKKIQGKKLQTIQNYVDTAIENDANNSKIDEQAPEENNSQSQRYAKRQKLQKKSQSPQKVNPSQVNQISSKNTVISEPAPKTYNQQQLHQTQNPNENTRFQYYQSLLLKPSQIIYQQLAEMTRNKSSAIRQSNPNILKLILNCIKKSLHGSAAVQHLQILMYHDWRKCKNLLVQFIQNSKLNVSALEYVKNAGILANQSTQINKRPHHQFEKVFEKEVSIFTTNQMTQSNMNPTSNLSLSSFQSNQNSSNYNYTVKNFYSSIQNILPKMSNPDPIVRLSSAEAILQLIKLIPVGSSLEVSSESSPVLIESINQFFNVLKCRVQDSNEEIANSYILLATQLLMKGFFTKFRTPGRQLISILLQKINNPHLSNLSNFLNQMILNHAVLLWQFFSTELPKQSMCIYILNIIKENNVSFFKHADQKSFILPLINCISKQLQPERCGELLDQIVQINGEQYLEKIVKQSKINSYALDNYLKKWHLQCLSSVQPHGQQKGTNKVQFNSHPVVLSKFERLSLETQNSWPLIKSPGHIIKFLAQMINLGEPFQTLASPTLMTQYEISLMQNLRNEKIEDYSDIFTKWVFWRMQIESHPKNIEAIFAFVFKLISVGFELQQSQIFTILGALISCLSMNKIQYLTEISKICSYFNQHPLYKEKSFRFWINSFNDSTAPVDQILKLIVCSYQDMIVSQLVTLARYPSVLRNKQFNEYLRANYTEKILTVYGFTIDNSKRLDKSTMSETLPIYSTQIQAKYFIQLFQRSSSNEIIAKINEETETIPRQYVMNSHIKIMTSIVPSYLNRQIPFINIYNYFKHLQKVIIESDCFTLLTDLIRTLCFFLVDLDQLKLQNYPELIKIVNKLILIVLQTSQLKKMLTTLFELLKQQIKNNKCLKLHLLLPKCVGKLLRNPSFRVQYEKQLAQNSNEYIHFVIKQFITILNQFGVNLEGALGKSVKNILGEIIFLFPNSVYLFEPYMNNEKILEDVKSLLQDISRDKIKENNFGLKGGAINSSKYENSSMIAQNNIIQSQTKEIKVAANAIKVLTSAISLNPEQIPINSQNRRMGQ